MASNTAASDKTPKKSPNRPRISARDPTFATILVGPEKVRFVVHEALLVHHSEFFRAALTGNFQEASCKTVTLEEEKPQIVELFIHWLYHGRFPESAKHDDEDLVHVFEQRDFSPKSKSTGDSLIQLYVFGDKYCIPVLARNAMDAIIDIVRTHGVVTTMRGVVFIFSNLDRKDPLCRFMIDFMVRRFNKKHFEEMNKFIKNPERVVLSDVLFECLLRFASENASGLTAWEPEHCDYHKHIDEEEKEACKQLRG